MFVFQVRRALLTQSEIDKFDKFLEAVPESFGRLIRPVLQLQSEIFRLPYILIRRTHGQRNQYERSPVVIEDGEVFTDGTNLFVVALERTGKLQMQLHDSVRGPRSESTERVVLTLTSFARGVESPTLSLFESLIRETMNVDLEKVYLPSRRLNELKNEGREAPSSPDEAELAAARCLVDRDVRTVAIAIKASGGLLVQDVPRQLQEGARNRMTDIQEKLLKSGIIDSETVVVCNKTQAQVARGPSEEFIKSLSRKGLKCACGLPIGEERIEEALTITERGRHLLEKSRWMTVLLLDELSNAGIPAEQTLIDQQMGGDEVDCLANISGELVLFELKDKEFSLGNAYSFGAKIGLVQPDHAVIVTSDKVGNDAKEHFERSRLAQRSRSSRFWLEERVQEVVYIEGMDKLREQIQGLAKHVYMRDAANRLGQVLPLMSIDAEAAVTAIGGQSNEEPTVKIDREVAERAH